MDDLVQALIAMAIIALGLLGGKKKKKPPPTGRTSTPTPAHPGDDRIAVTAQDIERILRMEAPGIEVSAEPEPEPEPPEPEPAVLPPPLRPVPASTGDSSWQAGIHRRARTAETLDRAGGASHERFHELYMDHESGAPGLGAPIAPSLAEVRRAIVWKEILDLPVSLREGGRAGT